jgi:two-component system, OmpR family, alkaline phosphatase synthesis response regulator PhoP
MSTTERTILLAEDEENLHEALKLNLELEGYHVVSAFTGSQALKLVQEQYVDLMILDIMMPEMDGIEVLEALRVQDQSVPVLVLSARDSSADRVLGLKKGADDYLTKPFNLEELLLRVSKLIQNSIDFKAQEARGVNGARIPLSKKEVMLLRLLIENRNEVVTREKILQAVWGYNVYPTTRTIDNFILNFRKYFEPDSRNPRYFLSVRGVGYKYSDA